MNFKLSKNHKTSKNQATLAFQKQSFDQFATEKGIQKLVLGVPEPEKITFRKWIVLVRKSLVLAKKHKVKNFLIDFASFSLPSTKQSSKELAFAMGTNLEMADYEFNDYKTTPKGGWDKIENIFFENISPGDFKELQRGKILGECVNFSRNLTNIPGAEMTPKILAKKIKDVFLKTNVQVKSFGEKWLKKNKMGAILSVGAGSKEESQFILLEHHGAEKDQKPLVLVGKAITFDTGGINIKPFVGGALDEMHMDMAGGAAVAGTILAASKMKLKKNIIGLIPAAENMVSGSSYRPGDIIKTLSGKTIEVANTDAEGRILLSDALTYAKKFKPLLVVDVATLTGAAMVALGHHASAFFTNSQAVVEKIIELSELSGDYLWQFPLWEEYEEEIKGKFADINNLGKRERMGGAITAAAFLFQFAKDYPWVHLDIAPRMTSVEGDWFSKGALGTPVRLLTSIAENLDIITTKLKNTK